MEAERKRPNYTTGNLACSMISIQGIPSFPYKMGKVAVCLGYIEAIIGEDEEGNSGGSEK